MLRALAGRLRLEVKRSALTFWQEELSICQKITVAIKP
jgi:hypothetical protein